MHSPVPKRARSESGARSRAAVVSVGPSSCRHAATASAPSSSIAATGPLVMNSGAHRWRPDYRSLTRDGTVDSEWVTPPDASALRPHFQLNRYGRPAGHELCITNNSLL